MRLSSHLILLSMLGVVDAGAAKAENFVDKLKPK